MCEMIGLLLYKYIHIPGSAVIKSLCNIGFRKLLICPC